VLGVGEVDGSEHAANDNIAVGQGNNRTDGTIGKSSSRADADVEVRVLLGNGRIRAE